MTNPYIDYGGGGGTGWMNTFTNPATAHLLPQNSPRVGQGYHGLRGIGQDYIIPEIERVRGGRSRIENALMEQTLEPGSLYGAASEAAGGYARELFKPGGEIASLMGRARGRSIGQGWSPEDAIGPENTILRGGVDAISNMFAQQAAGLEQARYGGLMGMYGMHDQGIKDWITSLYTGTAGAEQLKLAQEG